MVNTSGVKDACSTSKTQDSKIIINNNNNNNNNNKETLAHIMCRCSAIAQTLYTLRHDRMLRPVYYAILKTLGITNIEEDESIPWYSELQPKCCVETKEVKVLWNIPLHLDVVPKDGANKPDIAICNKKERQWLIFEGQIENREICRFKGKLKKIASRLSCYSS